MMKNPLIKVSARFHRYIRPRGNVEVLVERYADPRKPNLCKLWVVNGEHQFKQLIQCKSFEIKLADEVGGSEPMTDETYKAAWNKVIPTYTEEARAAAILG